MSDQEIAKLLLDRASRALCKPEVDALEAVALDIATKANFETFTQVATEFAAYLNEPAKP